MGCGLRQIILAWIIMKSGESGGACARTAGPWIMGGTLEVTGGFLKERGWELGSVRF